MTTMTHDRAVSAPSSRAASGLAFALVSAVTFGLSGALARPLLESGWSAGAVVLVRVGGAALLVAPLGLVSLGGFLSGLVGPVSAELKDVLPGVSSLAVLVQALQTNSDVNVLSTPHILASDNEDAEITVGQNVPFQAGYAPPGIANLVSGTNATTGTSTALGAAVGLGGLSSLYAPIQRQPVELRLKIKPQINEGGNVRLQIEAQNEEITDRDPQLGPTTSKRTVKTQIVAHDQSTIVIGGLIQVLGTLSANEAARAIEEGTEHRYQLRHRFGEALLAQAVRSR